jgi:PIN domain nuclease of toxin-antitoxin system
VNPIAEKSLGRDDLDVDARVLRRALLDNGCTELPTSQHAASIGGLPFLHRDPFDRVLVSQALCERVTLVTTDSRLAPYPAPVRKV